MTEISGAQVTAWPCRSLPKKNANRSAANAYCVYITIYVYIYIYICIYSYIYIYTTTHTDTFILLVYNVTQLPHNIHMYFLISNQIDGKTFAQTTENFRAQASVRTRWGVGVLVNTVVCNGKICLVVRWLWKF